MPNLQDGDPDRLAAMKCPNSWITTRGIRTSANEANPNRKSVMRVSPLPNFASKEASSQDAPCEVITVIRNYNCEVGDEQGSYRVLSLAQVLGSFWR